MNIYVVFVKKCTGRDAFPAMRELVADSKRVLAVAKCRTEEGKQEVND